MDSPLRPIDPARAVLRASDMDRERVVMLLQENYSSGRLTYEEFQERLEQAYASKTLGELATLTQDLPAEGDRSAPASSPAPADRMKRVRDRALTYVVLMLFLIGIWAATGAHGSFWPIWPILVGGLILAFDLLGLEGSGRRSRRAAYRAERRGARRARGRGDGGTGNDLS